MLIDGLNLAEGSTLTNATIASGTDFPPATAGELFFRSDLEMLHVFNGTAWIGIGTSSSMLDDKPGSYYLDLGNATGILSVEKGGTGVASLALLRTGLGLDNVQPLDADLTAIAGIGTNAGLLRKTAANTWVLDTAEYLTNNEQIALTGDVTGAGATAITTTLANVGTPGTYRSVTTDTKGRVVNGANPTTLAGYGITDALKKTDDTFTGTLTMVGDILPATNVTHNLGSPTRMWRDIYVGPGSIYMNGKKILEEVASTVIFSSDDNQNVRIETSGTGNLELQAAAGGAIQMKGTLSISSGKRIVDSAGIQVEFADNIEMTGNKITGLGYPIAGTDAANKAYVDGVTTADMTLVRTSGDQSIAGQKTFTGNVILAGNLTISGTTTTVNSQTVLLADNILELNSDFTTGTPSENAGIQIRRGDLGVAQFLWDEANDRFTMVTGANTPLPFYTGSSVTAASLVGPLTGNADSATRLQTARTINGASFDGTANISFTTDAVAEGTSRLYFTNARAAAAAPIQSVFGRTGIIALTSADVTGALGFTPANIASPTFTGTVTAPTFLGALNGNATTATSAARLTTARTINGVSFDGTANISFNSDSVAEGTNNLYFSNVRASAAAPVQSVFGRTGAVTLASGDVTGALGFTPAGLASPTFTGTVTAPTFSGALTGNATTATTLATARTINGVSFNGSANITITDSTKLALTGGTMTGGLTLGGTAPVMYFNETDQAAPGGYWRFVADGGGLRIDMNTNAAAKDLATYSTPWRIDSAGEFLIKTQDVADSSTRAASTAYVVARIAQDAGATAPVQSVFGRTGAVTLTTADITGAIGVLGIANGGTNSTATPTDGGIAFGTGTAIAYTAVGTSGQFLKSAGTGNPTWASLNLADMADAWAKRSVRVATTGPLTVSYASNVLTNTGTLAALAIDGVTLALNDRVLVKNQAAPAQNGIYTVTNVGSATVAWTLTRAGDANASAEIASSVVAIDSGTTYAGDLWTTSFPSTGTLNTTAMNWYEVVDSGNIGNYATTDARVDTTLAGLGLGITSAGPAMTGMDDATIPSGMYYSNSSTTGTFPGAGTAVGGFVLHKAYGSAGFQLFQAFGGDSLYYRRRTGSVWQPWVKLAHDVALTSADITTALGYTPLNSTANAVSATKLATARTINGVSFDGTANITVADATKVPLNGTGATGTWGISITGSSASTTGNAATATKLATARTINGVAFDGTANITVTAALPATQPKILIDRTNNVASGIQWYASNYRTWVDYMGIAGTAAQGPTANLTPPAGSLVTSWGRRSLIENSAGYGWTFESAGGSDATGHAVVAEIRASDGAARFAGAVTAAGGLTAGGFVTVNATDGWVRTSQTGTGLYNSANAVGLMADNTDGWKVTNGGAGFKQMTASQFNGSGAGLTGYGASFKAGDTNSVAGARWEGGNWTGRQVFIQGSASYSDQAGYMTEFQSTGSGGAALCAGFTFHRPGAFATNMGLDPDGCIGYGGISAGAGQRKFTMNMTNGDFAAVGNVIAYSDERLKTDWEDAPADFVEQWAGVKNGTYSRIDNADRRQVGVGAQSVQKILPHAVFEQRDGELALNYGGAAAVATVQLAKRVVEQDNEIKELKEQLAMVMQRLIAMENK